MNIAEIINSKISNAEKINLIEGYITELEQVIMGYEFRDAELVKQIKKPIEKVNVVVIGGINV